MAKAEKVAEATKTADVAERTDGTHKLSVRARASIAALKDSADCEIRSGLSPTVIPHLHRFILAMESNKIR